MKKPTYIVEVYASLSSMDEPDWHKDTTCKTLESARKYRTTLLNTTDWLAHEVRIVKSIREVVR